MEMQVEEIPTALITEFVSMEKSCFYSNAGGRRLKQRRNHIIPNHQPYSVRWKLWANKNLAL